MDFLLTVRSLLPSALVQVLSSGFQALVLHARAVWFCCRQGWENETDIVLQFPVLSGLQRHPPPNLFFCFFGQNSGFISEFLLVMPTIIIPKISHSVSQCQQLKDAPPAPDTKYK